MKQKFVVEEECEGCGAPLREGVVNVREAKNRDTFGSRQMCDHEIPTRHRAAAALAHPKDAIVVYGHCYQCHQSY